MKVFSQATTRVKMDADTVDAQLEQLISGLGATVALDLAATIARPLAPEASGEGSLPLISVGEPTLGAAPTGDVATSGQGQDLQLLGLLGSGGMGAVFAARQRALTREVAVKRPLAPDASPEVRAMLLREARTMGQLEHPNIVPVHALGCDRNGQPVLVMKRIEGFSWRELLRHPERATDPAIARSLARGLDFHIEIMMHLCNALHFAHSRGFIHRDVKPENVMIGAFGEVYLLDWGIARHIDQQEPHQVVGTPAYMAPEMFVAPENADVRTDVYLLGATLHEVLIGRPLHDGATLADVIRSALRQEPFEYPSSISPDLAALCRNATHPDPAMRPPTCAVFREALVEHAAHRTSRELSASAEAKLGEAELKFAGDRARLAGTEVGMLLAEARFGLEQSLRQWKENEGASQALSRCLGWSIEREILQRNGVAARALLSSLPTPRPDLETRVQDLEHELEAARAREVEQAHKAREMDASVSAKPRLLFFGVFGLVGVGLSINQYFEEQRTGEPPSMADQVQLDGGIVAILAVGLIVGRRRLLANAFNRHVWALWGIVTIGILLMDLTLGSFGLNGWQATVVDFMFFGVVFACGAALFDPFLGWIALTAGIAALVGKLVPSFSTTAATLALFCSIMLNVEQSRRQALRSAASAPTASSL